MRKSIVAVLAGTIMLSAQVVAAGSNQAFIAPISTPTLDEIGLGALIVLLGAVGGWVARRRK